MVLLGQKMVRFLSIYENNRRETDLLDSPRSLPDEAQLAKRQCSCKKLPNGEYICSGPKCPRDLSYMEEVD